MEFLTNYSLMNSIYQILSSIQSLPPASILPGWRIRPSSKSSSARLPTRLPLRAQPLSLDCWMMTTRNPFRRTSGWLCSPLKRDRNSRTFSTPKMLKSWTASLGRTIAMPEELYPKQPGSKPSHLLLCAWDGR